MIERCDFYTYICYGILFCSSRGNPGISTLRLSEEKAQVTEGLERRDEQIFRLVDAHKEVRGASRTYFF